jgi:hypothetical protein
MGIFQSEWRQRTATVLALAFMAAIAGCPGDASPTDSTDDASPPPAIGDSGAPDSADAGDAGSRCERFELVLDPTCTSCPSSETFCPCLREATGFDLLAHLPGCGINGRCLTSISSLACSELCAKAADGGVSAELVQDLEVLFSCVTDQKSVCSRDSECTMGRCAGESTLQGGRCSYAGTGAVCWEASDCLADRCIPAPPDVVSRGMFSPGAGLCSSGSRGEPCFSDGDCISAQYCLKNAGSIVGACFGGATGDGCRSHSDCQTNLCSTRGVCIAGDIGEACVDDRDCAKGTCVLDTFSQLNVCVSGELDTLCFANAQCQSGVCALMNLAGRRAAGFCESGEGGAPCSDNQDCKSGQCVSSRPPELNLCPAVRAPRAVPCGDGVCSTVAGFCIYGKCAP